MILLTCLVLSQGFTGMATTRAKRTQQSMPLLALGGVSITTMDHDELGYRQMLSKARECAFSDDPSPNEAKQFLHEIFHMEGLCVGGTVSGDVCENVDEVAALVVRLREQAVKADDDNTAIAHATAAEISKAWAAIFGLSLFFLLLLAITLRVNDPIPFQPIEWMWAIKDGYFWIMVSDFMRNGGL